MTYSIVPNDLLVLYGLIALFFYDPLALPRAQVQAMYKQIQRKIPFSVENAAWFGIAWSILYILMATSIFLMYLQREEWRTWVLYANFSLTGVILLCIKIWVPLFFGMTDRYVGYMLAAADCFVLLVAVVCFIVFGIFGSSSYSTAYFMPSILMFPAVLWLCYAFYLNVAALILA